MVVPGFTAELSLMANSGQHRHVPARSAIVSKSSDGDVTMQSCSVDALGVCSFWLEPCFYAVCAIPRIFGSGACTTCMTGCLYATNPLMAAVCADCVRSGPCTFSSPLSRILGCPFNLCA
jgi:hypothetical protein